MSGIVSFDDALEFGLRRDFRTPVNAKALYRCTNLRPTQHRLKDFATLTQPISDYDIANTIRETKAWPFPQFLKGKNQHLLAFEDAIYYISGAWDAWSMEEYDYNDAADIDELGEDSPDPASNTISKEGGVWHMLDFWNMWMLFNGQATVIKTPQMPPGEVYVSEDVTITTGCVFRAARAILGGFDSSDIFAQVDWPTYLAPLAANAPEHVKSFINAVASDPGQNWVWWSSLGGGDLFWLFSLNMMKYGWWNNTTATGYDDNHTLIGKLMVRNEFGMAPMPWQGIVQHLRPFADSVIVYGGSTAIHDGGVCALVPDGKKMGVHPLKNWGTQVGIADRGAVAGDESIHLFLDEHGELNLLKPNLEVERLGYREFFQDMLGGEPVISFDQYEREFYIGDGTDAYLFNRHGLAKAPWVPTTVSYAQGHIVGIYFDATDPDGIEIVTQPFDASAVGGTRGQPFEVLAVNVVGTDTHSTGWQIAVDYRLDKALAFTRSDAATLEPNGRAVVNIPGVECRLVLTHADRSKVSGVDSLYAEVNLNPKAEQPAFEAAEAVTATIGA